MDAKCSTCGVELWLKERSSSCSKTNPKFNLCCGNGLVVLPHIPDPPPELKQLTTLTNVKGINFISKIKAYNSALASISSDVTGGTKEDN